jgi:prepilin signal peptidase PulO-like enzyme (type II secretory pathway)
MITILAITFFVLGLIIGSFLNVVILRLNTERSFGGRSACMTCQSQLRWYELIPVFSFLALFGRCRTCKTKISFQYPLVELACGIVFAFLFLKFQDIFFLDTLNFSFSYAYYTAAFSLLLIIAVYDLKHKIIPDSLSLVFGILAFIGLFFFSNSDLTNSSLGFFPHMPSILDFGAGIFIALPFYLFWLVSKGKWMGLGDAKLAIGLGWLLGLSQALSGVVIAFWVGAVVGITLVVCSKKHGMKSEIPFAPYLVLGAFLAFVFGLHLFGSGFSLGFPLGFN